MDIIKRATCMLTLLVVLFSALLSLNSPAFAIDVIMGANGNFEFMPSDITIKSGETVDFIYGPQPPHNIVIKEHPELSKENFLYAPGDMQFISFPEPGDYEFWCGPHKGVGMKGIIHVK